jgi:mRNA-degrading endonuclease toxin of MazEF toxin-antitoxin module
MKYDKFDVIVTGFPFIEKSETIKSRPAVIISSDSYNAKTGFVVIAMITSAKHFKMWNDMEINDMKIADNNSSKTHPNSIIRMKFANITHDAIYHKIGQLNKSDQKKLSIKLKEIF